MTESLYERRLRGEWEVLQALMESNPGRLANTVLHEGGMTLQLLETPARLLDGSVASEHAVSIGFPVHYPAAPMTLHLANAVEHPNVHPQSGFVCLWADHRAGNTVEHALHKTVAILGGRLFNEDTIHVMQPEALPALQAMRKAGIVSSLYAPLQGVVFSHTVVDTPAVRRRRLS